MRLEEMKRGDRGTVTIGGVDTDFLVKWKESDGSAGVLLDDGSRFPREIMLPADTEVKRATVAEVTFTARIDVELLKIQRKWLLTQSGQEAEGLTVLLDSIADQAHDNHGLDCLLSEGDDLSASEELAELEERIATGICPACISEAALFDSVEIEDRLAIQDGNCPDCGHRWRSIYQWSGVSILDPID